MANSSAKKLLKANTAKLAQLRIIIVVSSCLYVLRFVLTRSFPRVYQIVSVILAVFYLLPYLFLRSSASPVFDAHHNLIDAGSNISASGLFEYVHDVIYLTVAVQLGVIFTPWMLLLYAAIPIFVIYTSCSGASSLMAQQAASQEQTRYTAPLARKDRRNTERKRNTQR